MNVVVTENAMLKFYKKTLENAATEEHRFTIDDIKHSGSQVRYYTGFTSYRVFLACYDFLAPSAEVMRMWRGSETTPDDQGRQGNMPGPKKKLPVIDQFFLVMVRLRLALGELDLSHRFAISLASVSPIFAT